MSFFFFHENQQNLIACAIISIREFEEDDLSKMVQSGRKRNSVFTPLLSPHSWSAGEFVVVSRSLIKLAFGRSSNTESVKHSGGALLQILFSLFYLSFCFFFSSFFLYLKAKRIYTRRSPERQFVKSLSVKNFNIDLVSTQTF